MSALDLEEQKGEGYCKGQERKRERQREKGREGEGERERGRPRDSDPIPSFRICIRASRGLGAQSLSQTQFGGLVEIKGGREAHLPIPFGPHSGVLGFSLL